MGTSHIFLFHFLNLFLWACLLLKLEKPNKSSIFKASTVRSCICRWDYQILELSALLTSCQVLFSISFFTVSGSLACPLYLFINLPLLPFCWEPVPSSVRLCIKIAPSQPEGYGSYLPDTSWGPSWRKAVDFAPSDMDLKAVSFVLIDGWITSLPCGILIYHLFSCTFSVFLCPLASSFRPTNVFRFSLQLAKPCLFLY